MKKPIGMDDPQKQEISKRRNFTFRINLFFFFTFFLFSVLIVRLAMLQFVEGKELQAEKAKINKANTPIPPIRGNIYDRMGAPIAYTTSTQSLYFRIEQDQPQDEVIALAHKLADIFAKFGSPDAPKMTAENIIIEMDVGYDLNKNKVTAPSYFSVPRRIKSGLTPDEMAYILEHRDELKWIEIMEESIRLYDQETIAVQLVGYMRPFSRAREAKYGLSFYKDKTKTEGYMDTEYVGYDGIELMYQEQLRGQNGMKSYPVNAQHKIIGPVEITKPVKGNNLFLSIDRSVQLTTEQAIMDHIKYLKSPEARANPYIAKGRNAVAGYAVAMEVETGKVVAMASMPDYDPSVWAGGIPQSEYDRIQPYVNNGTITTAYPDYPTKEERDKHPTSIVYMGSVIKPLSVLIGLNEGLFTTSTKYPDTGVFTYGRDNSARLRNSDGKAWGLINATQAIQYSSNTFMSAMIGNALYMRNGNKAIEIWDQYLAKFGLGVLTGSGLPKEYEGLSEYKTNTRESPQQRMVFASWGQNEKYTTLQLAQYATTLATRGQRLQPLLVDRIETYEGQLVKEFNEKVVLDQSEFPKAYWDAVIKGMENVGVQGFSDFPYKFARKTGTSTQVVGGKEVDNAVFIAFAPLDKPKLAVAVVVPEGGYGAYGAAPIARKIFDAYDQKYGLDGVPKGPTGTANAQQ
ncbi:MULTISPECIES: peptidoglycan D,D-transpeptidase FtsI family protein [Paenibacillus]|uniref:Cell division protein FtsI n=1 Tax=Paenibacillus naphthalenovorans TaxID=162209 RepID=A0A0U2UFI5_9BACL|nr:MULTISPECIES: penicillin-binding transpeptidase domain-containing protein [Paenibacillus]ALS20673.1 cell division protein FtsI [Paenibacillus naphthalenovorans]NTZ17904.1 penicillin-binding protein 2 [Paenibacillus sp. JMULE4]GCL70704.1 cell division protein FtsI [Paenibacillus naphthalenovorans]SDI25607.1 penicillin-binding protein 2 [Paenibacillus naphthalenovorans]